MSIERIPFGRTGHASARVIFGAAALAFMRDERTRPVLDTLLEYGVNHIDTAADYGDSELRLAPWLNEHPDAFFLATKTGARSAAGARESLERSLDRLGVDHVDMIQLHNLVDPGEWEQALGPDGALEALVRARDAGLTRFIGVTGHGWNAPEMHRRSLERFAFDSVLVPYNFTMLSQAPYAESLERLLALCEERGVAVQTIKSVARRRWRDGPERRFSWYEPVRDADALARAVRFVLNRPGIFLNSSSDAGLLLPILAAARETAPPPSADELAADVAAYAMEPLFAPDQDAI